MLRACIERYDQARQRNASKVLLVIYINPGERMDWETKARAVKWNVHPFVGGTYRRSTSTKQFSHINPATEAPSYSAPVGSVDDIDVAVDVARRRFNDGCWSGLSISRRAEILGRLADLIETHQEELALLDSLEMGKPIQAALYDARQFAPSLLRNWARLAENLLGKSTPIRSQRMSFASFEPRGVIGAITPWNFPSVNAIFKLGPALAAGNTVVLKPSELSPSSALRIAELGLEAGIPEGVINVVPGAGSTVGAFLTAHADVDMISFTGSTETGRKIAELAGRSSGKSMLLECGGKSPQIVFEDVDDIDFVATAVAKSFLWNQGQVCSAHTRLVVHQKVKHALVDRVVEAARSTKPANPLNPDTTFGPLASPVQRDRVKRYIDDAVNDGVKPILRGEIQQSGGCFVSPFVFNCPDRSKAIVREEVFGPVLCVQEFCTEEEAIALANGTDYGLGATVWTRDIGKANRAAHSIRAGTVSIRTSGEELLDPDPLLSHEPQKRSGFGSEIGMKGLQSYSTLKLVSFSGA